MHKIKIIPDFYYQAKEKVLKNSVFSDDSPQFLEEVKEEEKKMYSFYISMQYQRDRKEEYQKLNQDELRFNDLQNNTTTWQDAILAIKAKYPKP